MPTLCPGTVWHPLASQQPERRSRTDLVILHTMAGPFDVVERMFEAGGYGGTESTFGVKGSGEAHQWVDADCRADANLDANDRAISVETADMGESFPEWGGSDVPAWTVAQVEAIAQIVAWCCWHYSIPCELVPDSRSDRRGVAYHRQGIDPWRKDGTEDWSLSDGKVCPGDRRVNQVPEVINRAQTILSGDSEGDDMFEDDDRALLRTLALNEEGKYAVAQGQRTVGDAFPVMVGEIQNTRNDLTAVKTQLTGLAAQVAELKTLLGG